MEILTLTELVEREPRERPHQSLRRYRCQHVKPDAAIQI